MIYSYKIDYFSGGIGSIASGGDFFKGAVIGATVGLLNHELHKGAKQLLRNSGVFKKDYKGNAKYANKLGHKDKIYTLKDFVESNKGKSYLDIITQKNSSQGMPGGPDMRYVINPTDNAIMDMRHVMIIGYGIGENVGAAIEALQFLHPDTRPSSFNSQDFYSNEVGAKFFNFNLFSGNIFFQDWTNSFNNFITNNK